MTPMMQDANDDGQCMIVSGSLVDKQNEPKSIKIKHKDLCQGYIKTRRKIYTYKFVDKYWKNGKYTGKVGILSVRKSVNYTSTQCTVFDAKIGIAKRSFGHCTLAEEIYKK